MQNSYPEESRWKRVFPARYESLEAVRQMVGEAAQECGLKNAAVYAVEMAVDEAFTNIIEHAYLGESDEEITLACEIEKDQLVIFLRDCGRPFNPDEIPAPDVNAPLEERQVGGLGLFFMRNLMDEVNFSFKSEEAGVDNCNVLRMVKRKERSG